MTDLKAALITKRDELAEAFHDNDTRENFCFKAGADAMLALLWPCVEALEYISTAKPVGRKEVDLALQAMDFGLVAVADRALSTLRDKLEGGLNE